jgi:PIN domain nuclease of toxin-antitoxin system
MEILFDTHMLLWHLADDQRLKLAKSKIIEDPENEVFFSIVSLWEIAIKTRIGKLEISQPIAKLIPGGIHLLDLKINHIQKLENHALHHRDPFDRLLIAQAMEENLSIMTNDMYFKYYEIELI